MTSIFLTLSPSIAYKIVDQATLLSRLHHWRAVHDRIVFTNGCFDILHRGHIELLAQCREMGDQIILGLNSDVSVRHLKGPNRPINNQESRAIILAALSFIDAVIIFEEDTPLNLIKLISPDILVKGGDYKAGEIVGAEHVASHGGEVRIIPLVDGYSTTSIINKSSL